MDNEYRIVQQVTDKFLIEKKEITEEAWFWWKTDKEHWYPCGEYGFPIGAYLTVEYVSLEEAQAALKRFIRGKIICPQG